MNKRPLNRTRAAGIHLGISALLASLVFTVIYFVWYPDALFDAAGGLVLFLLIACVDVVIGPLITFIIFVPGKRGLKFDLVTIAVVQLAALSYGVWVLYESRPVWLVYVKDRYELVRANDILDEELAQAKPPFDELSITGPRIVGARQPADPQEQLRIGLSALQGRDLQTYPQYFVAYDVVRDEVKERARPIERLRAFNPGRGAEIDELPAKLGRPEARLGFHPLRAGKRDLTVLVDVANGDFLGSYTLKPWEY